LAPSAIDLPDHISPTPSAQRHRPQGLKPTAATIAGIFKGAITKRDDPAIKPLNSEPRFLGGDRFVVYLFRRPGTTQNFTRLPRR
jgi:phosphate transport system substrate-binding protein